MVVSSVIEKGWDAVQQGAESVGINPRSGFLDDDDGSRAIPGRSRLREERYPTATRDLRRSNRR